MGRSEEAKFYYQKLLEIQNQQLPKPVTRLPRKKLINQFFTTTTKSSSSPKSKFLGIVEGANSSALSVKENSPVPKLLLDSSQSLNKTIEAQIQDYLSKAKKNPNSAEIRLNLGNLYRKKQQWNQAIAYYHQAIQLNPRLGIAYQNLGQVYRKIGKEAEAIEAYYRFCRQIPRAFCLCG